MKNITMMLENQTMKVPEDKKEHYETYGWKEIEIVRGKKDEKGNLIAGEEDKIIIKESKKDDLQELKSKINELETENKKLKKELKKIENNPLETETNN